MAVCVEMNALLCRELLCSICEVVYTLFTDQVQGQFHSPSIPQDRNRTSSTSAGESQGPDAERLRNLVGRAGSFQSGMSTNECCQIELACSGNNGLNVNRSIILSLGISDSARKKLEGTKVYFSLPHVQRIPTLGSLSKPRWQRQQEQR